VAYGFEFDSLFLAGSLDHLFNTKTLLPATLTAREPNKRTLAIRVLAPGGGTLFETEMLGRPRASLIGVDSLPLSSGGLVVEAVIRPQLANQLIIGGLPRSRLPLLLAMLLVATALAVVAVVQLRRENELARLRADFVSSVSHELRTPLAQIRLFIETLRLGRAPTDEQRDWSLRQIDRETNRLAHLVENVLHFARVSRGRVTLPVLRPTPLAPEIDDVVRAFSPLADSRKATVRAELDPTLVAAIEPELLRQVLLNLLDNAVKYGPTAQTITVRLHQAGEMAHISVSDEGPGISEGDREAIWRPFHRGANAAARVVGGSGIGLSIVRDIVASLGGEIWLERPASDARGATFTIALPLVDAASTRPEPGAPDSAGRRAGEPIGGARSA
jgi:signal transduction histidine kinase